MHKLTINADQPVHTVSPHIYGHFAEHLGRCIYEGLWVGEDSTIPNTRGTRDDVVGALKDLQMPNLRWPGGCFADTYHWMDGIGPRESRPSIVNVHWGGTTENNHFGTHEFMDLCERLGCEPYICGNVGSGTVREMREWLEYLTMPGQSPMSDLRRKNGRDEPWPITYWAVGNENWGCGGDMTAIQYSQEYRRFACYCRNLSGRRLYKVACGHKDAWNEVMMREAGAYMDGLSVHYYAFPSGWEAKKSATGFPVEEWFSLLHHGLGIEGFLKTTRAIMDRHDPAGRVGMIVDEWGSWYAVEPGTNPGFLYQQNTIRDAILAAATLHIFHRHGDRVHMANIAQTVNVLQAMVLTDGPRMLRTPTYHVFEMMKVHQGGELLAQHLVTDPCEGTELKVPQITASATRSSDGSVWVSLANLDPERSAALSCEIRGREVGAVRGRILVGDAIDAHNTFEAPDSVVPTDFEQRAEQGRISLELPPRSVSVLQLV